MPIPSNPSRDEIAHELRDSNYAGFDLKGMWNFIARTGSYNRDSFAGYGRPSNLNITGFSNVSGIGAEVNCELDPNKKDTTCWAEFSETSDFASYSKTAEKVVGGDGLTGVSFSMGLDPSTKYYVRFVGHNLFNDGAGRGGYEFSATSTVTTSTATLETPNVSASGGPLGSNNSRTISASWDTVAHADDYIVYWKLNSDDPWNQVTITSSTSTNFTINSFDGYDGGDLYVGVKARDSGGYDNSDIGSDYVIAPPQ